MSFFNYDEGYYTGNNKQHLNLSLYAWETIQADMFTFKNGSLSGFLNRIFHYYHPLAEASVSLAVQKYSDELNELLASVCGDQKTKEKIANELINQKKKFLIKKNQSYEKGHPFKFWLNNSNCEYLSGEYSECKEELFYSTRGQYIKSVIEEYTRLPYVQRELVYFQESITIMKLAINKKMQLRIQTDQNSIYSVYPYKILCDPLSTTNYLVGYSKTYNSSANEKQPCSFKISALQSIKIEKSKSAFLKKAEKEKIETILNVQGVQFMVGNTVEEIKVKLSSDGVYKYQRFTHLRPRLVEIQDDNIFVFRCTPAQAEFYFFKFGEDAQVISPLTLRNKFKSMYQKSVKIYSAPPSQ